MGTPDILGTPGIFSFYTNEVIDNTEDVAGGRVFEVEVRNDTISATFVGPENSFRRIPKDSSSRAEQEYENPDLEIDFTVYLDPDESVAKLVVQDEEFISEGGGVE